MHLVSTTKGVSKDVSKRLIEQSPQQKNVSLNSCIEGVGSNHTNRPLYPFLHLLIIQRLLNRRPLLHPLEPIRHHSILLDIRQLARIVLPRHKRHVRVRVLAADQPRPVRALGLALEVVLQHAGYALNLLVVPLLGAVELLGVEPSEPDGLAVVWALAGD